MLPKCCGDTTHQRSDPACHPLLPAGDAQREVDEAGNAIDVAVAAEGVADALSDGYDPESGVANSSDAPTTLFTADNGQSSGGS